MVKLKALTTPIKIEKPGSNQDSYGQLVDSWEVIGENPVFCQWKNAHGAEVWQALATQTKEPATLRMWYFEGVTPECRVTRLSDNAVYNIISIDNIENRNQIIELKVQMRSGDT